ncbi:MAG: substrate-binding domain-containing protein [Cytophagaceae bacterium]|nr:substrate-binding domain-containing protein [Cytophagaceae bacterium]
MYRKNLLYKLTHLLLIPLLILQSCSEKNKSDNQEELEGTITVSGAFALYPLVVKWGEEFEKLHPKVKVDVTAGGAGKGITHALHDNVNLGMVSRDVRQEEISQGAWGLTVARDAVLPTINADNPFIKEILLRGISKEEFYKIWISGEIKTWGELLNNGSKNTINKFKRSDASGAGETWAKFFEKPQSDLQGIGVFGDPGVAHSVIKDKFAIGFNNIAYVYDLKTQVPVPGLYPVPIDLNGNDKIDSVENFYHTRELVIQAISRKQYPSPPARELYFVSHGPPKDRVVIEFFKWILTDGQKFVPEMGYLKLSPFLTQSELEMLNLYLPREEK